MGTLSTSLNDLSDVIERGLRQDLKGMIKNKLLASIDQTLEDMAIEIANNIVINTESMQTMGGGSFEPETRIVVNFNVGGSPMVYDAKTKEVKRRDYVKRD